MKKVFWVIIIFLFLLFLIILMIFGKYNKISMNYDDFKLNASKYEINDSINDMIKVEYRYNGEFNELEQTEPYKGYYNKLNIANNQKLITYQIVIKNESNYTILNPYINFTPEHNKKVKTFEKNFLDTDFPLVTNEECVSSDCYFIADISKNDDEIYEELSKSKDVITFQIGEKYYQTNGEWKDCR